MNSFSAPHVRQRSFAAVIGLALLLCLGTACSRSNPDTKANASKAAASPAGPSEEDLRVAREAMSISEVVAQLRAGVPKEKVLDLVQRRRLTSLAVPSAELELAANGADHKLLAALKDPANLITPAQETAYMHVAAERAAAAKKPTAAVAHR